MNTFYATTLYDELIDLTDKNEAFYYADHELDGLIYRIFNYRLASYSDFLLPSAMECRGSMFRVSSTLRDAKMLELVSLPMEKFFNLHENPMTMDLDLSQIESVMVKADGSLISTFSHFNNRRSKPRQELRLKSKGSLASDQAIAAMKWLDLPENYDFKDAIERVPSFITVNMEWCAPDNRIVIGYENAHLKILNMRNMVSGAYIDVFNDTYFMLPEFKGLRDNWIEYENPDDVVQFVKDIPDMTDIEGYVVRLSSGQHVKIKTGWYMALHHTKDSINSPRRLFEAVLEEATDDMRSLFFDDVVAIRMIDEMEQKVEKIYNHLVDSVERFYERNKDLERKEYAILGQRDLDRKYFGLAMSKYLGQEVNYKDFLKRKYKEFGIKDEDKDE